MRRLITGLALTSVLVLATVAPTFAANQGLPDVGTLYLDGAEVGTIVPPSATPKQGRDNFYGVPNQFGVAAVGPGDKGYHGGQWAFHSVVWNVAPYTLTSEAAVLAAASNGDVTVMRVPARDFKCPILRNR